LPERKKLLVHNNPAYGEAETIARNKQSSHGANRKEAGAMKARTVFDGDRFVSKEGMDLSL
jgi:hypothetical protein